MPRLMNRLLTLTTIALTLLTALWFASAAALRQGVRSVLAEGGPIDAQAVDVRGFPGALDLVLRRPVVTDPAGLWVWVAPRADLRLAATAPTTLRATLPREQALMLGGVTHAIRSTLATAEITLAPRVDLRLRRAALQADGLMIEGLAGARDLQIEAVQDSAQPLVTLTLRGDEVTLPPALHDALPLDLALPATIARLAGKARLTLDQPLTRETGTGAPVRLMAADLDGAQLAWGRLAVQAQGAVKADAQGMAEGRIMLRVTGWDVLLPLLAASGAIKPEVVPTVANALTRLQITPPDGGAPYLELPLILRAGRVSLGPLPLGEAPRLW